MGAGEPDTTEGSAAGASRASLRPAAGCRSGRRRAATVLAAAFVVTLASCGAPEGEPRPGEAPSATEAPPLEPPPTAAVQPTPLAPGVISTSGFELGVSFAPDGRSVYFTRVGDGFETSVIVVSHREGDGWSVPRAVSFAGEYRDIDPFVSTDGRQLFFQSDRPVDGVEAKDWDIWVADREGDDWGAPRNLGPPINTPGVETYPVVTADGSLYFSSDRAGGEGQGDVYRARFVDGRYLEPENLGPPINTAEFDSNAFVAPDESYLILSSSSLPGHLGSGDLYISRRRDGRWSELEQLPLVNTPAREFAPAVSPDGTTLLFTRDQRDPALGPELLGDIYQIELGALGIE